jgi:hypothetical protein
MARVVLLFFCVVAAVSSRAAAQSYQQYSDGSVSVQVRKVVDQDQRIGFEVCARLLRQEMACPLEVRLNFWEVSGRFLVQTSSVLHPELSAPICQSIPLPEEARAMSRWEIARFRCQRQGARGRSVDGHTPADPTHLEVMAARRAVAISSTLDGH